MVIDINQLLLYFLKISIKLNSHSYEKHLFLHQNLLNINFMVNITFSSLRSFKPEDLHKFSDLLCVLYKCEFTVTVKSELSGLMYLSITCNSLLTFAEMHSIVLNALSFFRNSTNHFGLESLLYNKVTHEKNN